MFQKVSTSSQKAARSSSRSVNGTFFETDPETDVARQERYDHRDTRFVFTNGTKVLISSLEGDKWPFGTTSDEKQALKPGDNFSIIYKSLPCDHTFLGRGNAKIATAFKTDAERRLSKGLPLLYLNSEDQSKGQKVSIKEQHSFRSVTNVNESQSHVQLVTPTSTQSVNPVVQAVFEANERVVSQGKRNSNQFASTSGPPTRVQTEGPLLLIPSQDDAERASGLQIRKVAEVRFSSSVLSM